jgi:hypothetical protein
VSTWHRRKTRTLRINTNSVRAPLYGSDTPPLRVYSTDRALGVREASEERLVEVSLDPGYELMVLGPVRYFYPNWRIRIGYCCCTPNVARIRVRRRSQAYQRGRFEFLRRRAARFGLRDDFALTGLG